MLLVGVASPILPVSFLCLVVRSLEGVFPVTLIFLVCWAVVVPMADYYRRWFLGNYYMMRSSCLLYS